MTVNAYTQLVITAIGVPPYSARGVSQTLTPIRGAEALRRTINGELDDLSVITHHKYASTISCDDQDVPAMSGVWPGQQVTVDCVIELGRLTSGPAPERPVVPGSERVDGSFTFYRPRLTMRIVGFDTQKDEYGASVGWSMDLEEV